MLNQQLLSEFEFALDWADRMFALLSTGALYERPIDLRHPNIFYYGHLPAFASNQILRRVLGEPSFNQQFDRLFERGIDPPTDGDAPPAINKADWPDIIELSKYRLIIEQALFDVLSDYDLANAENTRLRNALEMTLEHYLMHIETFLYMQHQLAGQYKIHPLNQTKSPAYSGPPLSFTMVAVAAGNARLGTKPRSEGFAWCNEFSEHQVPVPAFRIDRYNVTNGQFQNFVEDGGYFRCELWTDRAWRWVRSKERKHPQFWKPVGANKYNLIGLFDEQPLPEFWPVYVTQAEAAAYARWRKLSLPTEAEYHRAAYGSDSDELRAYPWGNDESLLDKTNTNMQSISPTAVGSSPETASYWGVEDLVGNGWEWTESLFSPFEGFQAYDSYPGYSADFFDQKHYVMKGGSPLTAKRLLRPSFRNWFQSEYPYMYATFRCVAREEPR